MLSKRYVDKQNLFCKLDELFPSGNYEVEVRYHVLHHIYLCTAERVFIARPRRLHPVCTSTINNGKNNHAKNATVLDRI